MFIFLADCALVVCAVLFLAMTLAPFFTHHLKD